MADFELETIEPETRRGRSGQMTGREWQAMRDEIYAKGYKDGVDTAVRGIEAEKSRYLSALNETLQDQRFDFDQASTTVQASVSAMVEAVSTVLAPSLAGIHFQERIQAVIVAATRKALDGQLVLKVSPECHDAVSKDLAASGTHAKVLADEALSGMVAELDWEGGTDRLDLDGAVEVIKAATTDYVTAIKEAADERHRRAG